MEKIRILKRTFRKNRKGKKTYKKAKNKMEGSKGYAGQESRLETGRRDHREWKR